MAFVFVRLKVLRCSVDTPSDYCCLSVCMLQLQENLFISFSEILNDGTSFKNYTTYVQLFFLRVQDVYFNISIVVCFQSYKELLVRLKLELLLGEIEYYFKQFHPSLLSDIFSLLQRWTFNSKQEGARTERDDGWPYKRQA